MPKAMADPRSPSAAPLFSGGRIGESQQLGPDRSSLRARVLAEEWSEADVPDGIAKSVAPRQGALRQSLRPTY
jgi:hypothetical protein